MPGPVSAECVRFELFQARFHASSGPLLVSRQPPRDELGVVQADNRAQVSVGAEKGDERVATPRLDDELTDARTGLRTRTYCRCR
jgi:hypothetical protein